MSTLLLPNEPLALISVPFEPLAPFTEAGPFLTSEASCSKGVSVKGASGSKRASVKKDSGTKGTPVKGD